ncbi:metallophosphoesterase family protein [Candidatus Dependentiae bacterium]
MKLKQVIASLLLCFTCTCLAMQEKNKHTEKQNNQQSLLLQKYNFLLDNHIQLRKEKKDLEEKLNERTFWEWYHYNKIDKKEFDRVIEKFTERFSCLEQFDGLTIMKLTVNPNTIIILHADIHGDKYSLLKFLKDLANKGYLDEENPFKINKKYKKNFYIAFLGDYTDREKWGAEVLYTVMRLKLENPKRVLLFRGNHEDTVLNNREDGLGKQLEQDLGYKKQEWERKMKKAYVLLPLAAYVRVKGTPYYLILCHAGLEPRFNPHPLLSAEGKHFYIKPKEWNISWLSQTLQSILKKNTKIILKEENPQPEDTGFLWNDFDIETVIAKPSSRGGNATSFGKFFTKQFLKECSKEREYEIVAIFRGHQHADAVMKKMVSYKGIYQLWSMHQWNGKSGTRLKISERSIWTLNVSPGGGYGSSWGYSHTTYAILRLPRNHRKWSIEPRKVKIDPIKVLKKSLM